MSNHPVLSITAIALFQCVLTALAAFLIHHLHTPTESLTKAVRDVFIFRKVFGQNHRCRPGIPTLDDIKLQTKLIDEEYTELKDAIRDRNIIQVADGSADLIYVILHNCLAWGIDLAPIWDEVQRTNLAKLGGPKSPDGKQLKPAGWTPPDIRTILRNQSSLHTIYSNPHI